MCYVLHVNCIDYKWHVYRMYNVLQESAQQLMSKKVFVARCTENITADDLLAYFSKFGDVTDVFIPKPFRAFAFVTFADPKIARSLCGEDHIIKKTSVHVTTASPKGEKADMKLGNRGGNKNWNHQQGWGGHMGKPMNMNGPHDPNLAGFGMNLVLAAAQVLSQQGQIPPPQPQPVSDSYQQGNSQGFDNSRQTNSNNGFFGANTGAGWGTNEPNNAIGGYSNWGGGQQQPNQPQQRSGWN